MQETKEPLPSSDVIDIWEELREEGILMGKGGFLGNVRIVLDMERDCILKEGSFVPPCSCMHARCTISTQGVTERECLSAGDSYI